MFDPMSPRSQHQKSRPVQTVNPMPGLWAMGLLCLPYLSNSMATFPRSTAHDHALAAIVIAIWGVVFSWDVIERRWPKLRLAIEAILGLFFLSVLATLFGTVYYLLLIR
jgi:hypothetical protein